jgi:hypothetical protein
MPMLNKAAEKVVAKWIYLGVPAVSLLVTGFINYDPVNVAKMVLTVGIGISIISILVANNLRKFWEYQKSTLIFLSLFLSAGLVPILSSSSPVVQNVYGVFGRNTGYLTYVGLAGILAGASVLTARESFHKLTKGLIFAGIFNVVICALEISGVNVFGFNNIYNTILGTFGNPNFISSFLGIFISAFLAYVVSPGINKWLRILSPFVIAVAFYEILHSNSIQGIVVTSIGFGVVGFMLVRAHLKKLIFQLGYLLIGTITAGFGVAGALQVGPLTQYIYKTSVSLRGEYWRAGIKMGMDNPLTGVGFDAYGDWYRFSRSASAMIMPGPRVITNSAHNVNIDIFAYGGFPLVLSYLGLLVLAMVSIIKVLKRNDGYDKYFYPIATAWVCYQAQALISINQIGLAIWGWALTGAVIGYERATRERYETLIVNSANTRKTKKSNDQSVSVYLTSVIGLAIGISIACPPFLADANWRSSMKSGNVELVQSAATNWPLDSYRLANVALVLEQNKFPQQAYEIAKELTLFNPNNYDGWKLLAGLSLPSQEEKINATNMMRKLDPRNLKLE